MKHLTALLFLVAFTLAANSGQQQRSRSQAGEKPAPAANAWMLVPTPTSTPDTVAPSLRHSRDQYYETSSIMLGLTEPLSSHMTTHAYITSGGIGPGQPEIPAVTDKAVFIAQFIDSRSFLTSSGRLIYTEMVFHVTDAFKEAPGSSRRESDITISCAGGTVKTDEGEVLSIFTDPRPYFFEPGKTYLLFLRYLPAQDLYTAEGRWEISGGVVKANTEYSKLLAEKGASSIVGLTLDQLRVLLNNMVQGKH